MPIEERITQIHLVRHGEVYNPDGVLYGRASGYHLSDKGQAMARRLGYWFSRYDLAALSTSPLERAQETMAPIAAAHSNVDVHIDDRLIEADNAFEGQIFGRCNKALLNPKNWYLLRNPLRPSWGEPYRLIAQRMKTAIVQMAIELEPGSHAVMVSHQLPIWIARLSAEGKSYIHDPRRRQCTVASVTTFRFDGPQFAGITYAEPARDLLGADANRAFSSGR